MHANANIQCIFHEVQKTWNYFTFILHSIYWNQVSMVWILCGRQNVISTDCITNSIHVCLCEIETEGFSFISQHLTEMLFCSNTKSTFLSFWTVVAVILRGTQKGSISYVLLFDGLETDTVGFVGISFISTTSQNYSFYPLSFASLIRICVQKIIRNPVC